MDHLPLIYNLNIIFIYLYV